MGFFSLGLLPVSQVTLATLTFILSYVWAVARHDVTPTFPFISDTGANRPESCFFSQMLNLSAFITFFIMYIRFRSVQLKMSEQEGSPRWMSRVNTVSSIFGVIAAFGVSLVANFQDNSELYVMHFVGASLAFGLGVLYAILQTMVSYRLQEERAICRWRLTITVLCVAAGISMAASWTTANAQWHSRPNSEDKLWWRRDDPGFVAHVCSTAFEWVLSLGFFLFFLTYVKEFDGLESEIILRPVGVEGVQNGRPRSTSQHSINAFYNQEQQPPQQRQPQQQNAGPGERTRLLGAGTDFNKNHAGYVHV